MSRQICFIILSILLASCAGRGGKAVKLNNKSDSLAYVISYYSFLDRYLSEPQIDPDIVMRGIRAGFAGDTTTISSEEGSFYINRYLKEVVPARNLKEAQDLLYGVVTTNKKARITESGLVYEILVEGTGKRADSVENIYAQVVYSGWFPDGRVVDPETKVVMNVNNGFAGIERDLIIEGLQQGAQLVNSGGKVRLWVHPYLAYGEPGDYDVRPNQALIYELEVIKVDKQLETE